MTGTKARHHCRLCGEPPRAGETLTHSGYHFGCGMAAAEQAAREMAERSGPRYEAWLRSRGPLGVNQWTVDGAPDRGEAPLGARGATSAG